VIELLIMQTIIYGNGAMAKVLYSYAKHSMKIAAFTVDDQCIAEGADTFCGLPLVPFSWVEEAYPSHHYQMLMAVGFIEMNTLRLQKYQEAKAKGYAFTRYIHPSVILHDDVEIAENSIVLDCVSIHPGCKIGHSAFISSNTNIGHDCIIEHSNWINAGVSIAGGCHIGACGFFGVNASLGHGVTLGERNLIAANTLVTKSSEDDQVFISAPGQLFKLKSRAFLKFCGMLR
jgi:sugar O-acyltransferase (sialic acid O-acetyltransferase NeuD family)